MSRLGDLIRLERTRQGLSYKQVARKCGVSDKYLMEVESGKRIIADDQARRILKTIGLNSSRTEAEFTLDDIASTVDLQSAVTSVPRIVPDKKLTKKEKQEGGEDSGENGAAVPGSIWLDALSSVLKHVPVYNAAMKEIGHRLLPISNGKIEGASPDKVYYLSAPDNQLRGFRVMKGDCLLVVPASAPADGALMVLDTPFGKIIRKTILMERFQVMLQTYDAQCESEIRNLSDITVVGRCVRLEAEL